MLSTSETVASGTEADRYTLGSGQVFVTGVQALIRALLDQRRSDQRAGLRTAGYVSGYPGSPLGGVDLELHRQRTLLDEYRIVHAPGLNEDLAATAVMGTQILSAFPKPTVDGVAAVWYGKAPGGGSVR